MAFKPNYNQQRAERSRAKERKKQEKLQKREERAAERKAEQARQDGGTQSSAEPDLSGS